MLPTTPTGFMHDYANIVLHRALLASTHGASVHHHSFSERFFCTCSTYLCTLCLKCSYTHTVP